MPNGSSGQKGEHHREERRYGPYTYQPETIIEPDAPTEEQIHGVTRNESEHGFSATFDSPFPHEEGDVLDVRVGFRRTWAEVKWTRKVMEEKVIVGFHTHPRHKLGKGDEE
ncbi:MAG: hypothetical protein ABEJ65_11140 [bacterium]